jgi:hypothetical protein
LEYLYFLALHKKISFETAVKYGMDCIFAPGQQIRYWLDETGHNYTLIDDIDVWKNQSGRQIAAFELLELDQALELQIQKCCDIADIVILFVPEFINDTWCRKFDRPNVVLFLGGKLNWIPKHARCHHCLYFFWSTCDFYRTYPDLLHGLDTGKDLVFDVLLGRRKPHRDLIFHGMDPNRNIITYFPEQEQDIRSYDDSHFVWPHDVLPRPQHAIEFTVQEVQVNGVIVSLSQIIPREIYQRTCYSLVAETETANGWSFFTEKITKPILSQRLFLVVSGQHYLANLRSLGFQTFDGIVDESYDDESDLHRRVKMVLEQARYLESRCYRDVSEEIQSIVKHNQSMMMGTDWQGSMIKQLSQVLCK